MRLVIRNGRYVLHIAPNFAIHVNPKRVKPVDGSKQALIYIDAFDGLPVLADIE
jgi:hypothetical protein